MATLFFVFFLRYLLRCFSISQIYSDTWKPYPVSAGGLRLFCGAENVFYFFIFFLRFVNTDECKILKVFKLVRDNVLLGFSISLFGPVKKKKKNEKIICFFTCTFCFCFQGSSQIGGCYFVYVSSSLIASDAVALLGAHLPLKEEFLDMMVVFGNNNVQDVYPHLFKNNVPTLKDSKVSLVEKKLK
jgi:hypothetical protein